MRRVVITGMGILSPLGRGLETNWDGLMAAKSAIVPVRSFDAGDYTSRVAGEIPLSPEDFESVVPGKEQRRMDRFVLYGLIAAADAVADSGWTPADEESLCRTGVILGSGIGGIRSIQETTIVMNEHGPRRITPFFIPSAIANILSGHVSIRFGYKGPNLSVVTACATGTHAVGESMRLIRDDMADVMIAGGAEAAVCEDAMGGFAQMKALSTNFNDAPEKASRPWDKARDGFVMGEGSGVLVLEEYGHAKARGAKIYAEVAGYGMSGDAYHITAPDSDGDGAYRAMVGALRLAGMNPDDIGYVNAHGTSTPLGDMVEVKAVKRLFGGRPAGMSMSSTKSAVGHLLGAAGAVEAIYSIQAMNAGILPPTLNLDDPEDGCDGLDLIPHTPREKKVRAVMSNSFGFGGTNATLILKAV